MADINAAWTLLRDDERRRAWNREHGLPVEFATRRPGPESTASPPGQGAPAPSWAQPASAGRTGSTAGTAGSATGSSAWRRGPHGEGAAGPPPGPRRGSVLPFGRHIGWSLGEIARVDPGYLEWLHGRREGAPYRAEIEALLAATRSPQPSPPAAAGRATRRRLFR
jgi:hypothetical protein